MRYVDTRWVGNSGIGRYSQEVTARLSTEWHRAPLEGNPLSPSALLTFSARGMKRDDIYYSPGFAVTRTSARQFITIHDLIHRQGPGASWKSQAYFEAVVKPLVLRSGCVFTISHSSAEDLDRWINNDKVDIQVIPAGISEAFQEARFTDRHKGTRPYLLYVGNLRPHKNFPVVLEAMQLLPDYDLRVVSIDAHHVRKLATRYGVESQVFTTRDISDEELIRLYRGAELTLVPSLVEGFGMPALESIACGTPVVYSISCKAVAATVGSAGEPVLLPRSAPVWAHTIKNVLGNRERFSPAIEAFSWPDWTDTVSLLENRLDSLSG
jgi:glycosyltransferase involved in cell wall biosynthesis